MPAKVGPRSPRRGGSRESAPAARPRREPLFRFSRRPAVPSAGERRVHHLRPAPAAWGRGGRAQALQERLL